MDSPLEFRIADLEIRLAVSEDHLEELNRIVFRQREQMDLLQAQLRELHRQLRDGSEPRGPGDPRDEIPPHY